MKTTNHAAIRAQQRGLAAPAIEIIVNYGHHEKTIGGAEVYVFGKKECDQALISINRLKKIIEGARNGRVIIKDERVITLYKKK